MPTAGAERRRARALLWLVLACAPLAACGTGARPSIYTPGGDAGAGPLDAVAPADVGSASLPRSADRPVPPDAACGHAAQACCVDADGVNCADGLACVAGTCEPCGGRSQACCEIACQPGLACQNNRCEPPVPCGARGQRCCVLPFGPVRCDPGLGCEGDLCASCGEVGQTCCGRDSPAACSMGAVCAAGRCAARPAGCGLLDEPCCAEGACVAGGECRAGRCAMRPACGERGLPCCSDGPPCQGGVCQGGLCLPPPAHCGRTGQPCCDGRCAPVFQCVQGVCQLPMNCGEVGQPCCPAGDGCRPGAVCEGDRCVQRSLGCGMLDQPCCDGRCAPGYRCAAAVCAR